MQIVFISVPKESEVSRGIKETLSVIFQDTYNQQQHVITKWTPAILFDKKCNEINKQKILKMVRQR